MMIIMIKICTNASLEKLQWDKIGLKIILVLYPIFREEIQPEGYRADMFKLPFTGGG